MAAVHYAVMGGGALRSNGGACGRRCMTQWAVHYAVLYVCNLLVRFSFTLKKYLLHIWSNFLRCVPCLDSLKCILGDL
jgi:hypothetical protein